MNRVAGKVALVTGAARGQGRSHAERLAAEGADLILVDLCADVQGAEVPMGTREELEETKRAVEAVGRRAHAAAVDVRDREGMADAVRAGVEEVGGGGLDIVVANAGICTLQHWHDVTPEIWRATLDVNLTGAWNTCAVSAPLLVERGGGSIILISSVAGLKGMAFLLPYAVSKHGVVGLMRALSNELAEQRVRVNTIHPGGVDTPMNLKSDVMQGMIEERPHLAPVFQNTMGVSLMEPGDISDAVLYLASDESRFVTGVELPVAAGATAV